LICHLLNANASAKAIEELLLHPQYAASAALRTRESVYALFDALVAAESRAVAAKTAGTIAPYRLASALIDSIAAAAASISECHPRSPDDPDRVGWPPADLYCDGLLRPGVITALLGMGLWWEWESRESEPGRNPISATRFWLRQLIRNRRPEAGSARLNLPVPTPCFENDNPRAWAALIGTTLVRRLDQLPAAAQPAPLLSQLTAWLNVVPELHSVFGDNVMQAFATSSILCCALMLHITTPALLLELRQHAGAVIHLLKNGACSDGFFSDDASRKWESRAVLSGFLQLVAGIGSGSDSGSSRPGREPARQPHSRQQRNLQPWWRRNC